MSIPESHLAQEAVAALVDGELTSGAASRAARHLAGCLQCRMAVAAQREAKEVLHRFGDVAVPGDLLCRLRGIPFTADVSAPGGGSGTLSAIGTELTVSDSSGAWSLPLQPRRPEPADPSPAPPRHGRWLRRGAAGTVAALALGGLALALPADGVVQPQPGTGGRAAISPGPEQPARGVSPELRTVTVGDTGSLPPRGGAGQP